MTAFRTAVIENIPEPGATPDSKSSIGVTDIIAAAPEPTAMVRKALDAVLSVVRPAARYRVVVDYLLLDQDRAGPQEAMEERQKAVSRPGEASATSPPTVAAAHTEDAAPGATPPGAASQSDGDQRKQHVVVAQIFDARTGRTMHVVRESDRTKQKALLAAAYATAGWILTCSDVVPDWAEWTSESARAFAVYDESRREKSPDPEKLLEAQRDTPRSGVLSVLAAHQQDIAGNHAVALELYVRAALVSPRFLAARYRVGIGLSVLASDPSKHWWGIGSGAREALVGALVRLGRELRLGDQDLVAQLANQTEPECWTGIAEKIAAGHLAQLGDSYSLSAVWMNALRRKERVFWWTLIRTDARWKNHLMISIAKSGLDGKLNRKDFTEHEKRCRDSPRALYNLACWSLRSEPTASDVARAIELLEEARDAPGGHHLNRTWFERDPDLERVQQEPRFRALLATLPREG